MTARTIVEAERHENLVAFEETFAKLEGVTDEHVTTLCRASSTTASTSPYPHIPKAKTRSARPPTPPLLCAGLPKPWPRCKDTRRSRAGLRSRHTPCGGSAQAARLPISNC
jgi:hypothetical protein